MAEPALDIKGLSYALGGAPILRGVSAAIGAGERWSLLGANGAGKSTLLKCVLRIYRGWEGAVHLFGQPLSHFSQRELARQAAYVPQAGGEHLFPYTVREFVRMGRYAYQGPFGAAHAEDRAAIEEAMARTGVQEFAERRLDTLSGGERQKVFMAAALAQGCRLLLLDEPTAFLDYKHQAEVLRILQEINEETGAAIVTVTHDINTALLTGGHALALRKGQTAFCGPVEDLANEERLAGIFDARFHFIQDTATGVRVVAPQGIEP